MNAHRAEQLLAGQSGLSKKVYLSVPVGEGWLAKHIAGAISNSGSMMQPKTVTSCLGLSMLAGKYLLNL